MTTNVVQLGDFQKPKAMSCFKKYPLPFFNSRAGKYWDVSPTGDYGKDCETGRAFAIEFLASCDGTVGWSVTLGWIVADMIAAGCESWPDGGPKPNGIVVGFIGTIGKYIATH